MEFLTSMITWYVIGTIISGAVTAWMMIRQESKRSKRMHEEELARINKGWR